MKWDTGKHRLSKKNGISQSERKIIGNQTGRIYNSLDEFSMQDDDGGYHVGDVQVGTTHHDAVTQQVWVVDQAAWDQTVIVGYR